jgi:enoyl-CoA hydratase/carnithine racemase
VSATDDAVLVGVDDRVATVTLNRPASLNALSESSWRELGRHMRELSRNLDLRCVILRGAGDKAFGVGADITEFPRVRSNAAQGSAYGELIHSTMLAIGECTHPTIAMIHGACVGGGLEVALMCDLRICGESSRFGIPISRLGLTMGYGELEALLATVGRATSLELLLEGRILDAREALAKGLVQRVVADAAVESETRASAARIAAGAPLVARWHKRFVRRLSPALALSADEWREGFACFDTEDYQEGVRAFLAKRDPRFEGR